MWIRHIFLTMIGLASGLSIAAGTFAFIIMVGIVPRIVGKSNTAVHVLCYENAILLGGIAGNILSVFLDIRIPMGRWILILYGLSAGIFEGCIAVALAEILKGFPILFRRVHIKEGLPWVMVCMALGKMAGGFFYFFFHIAAN